ncbi:hypothetical protein KCG44_03110 [Pacificimonas sp. WHA3]|uniref:Uncharacterized protein n=1 Tax=Pacificimonas pallii TaxID=2827236 RepID=A0ABS6SBR9_9SPHN|nr:hypothetical protein [Pacificimonas pallii]
MDSENSGSIAFHKQMGFQEIGRLPEIGRKFERWLSLVLMHRLIGRTP